MKNIISKLLVLLTLFLGSSFSALPNDIEISSDTLNEWTDHEVKLMANLIPILYKEVLRLDSCVADGQIQDSMIVSLNNIIDEYEVTVELKEEIIRNLNEQIKEYKLQLEIKNDIITGVKKESFWRGFRWGSSGAVAIILIIILL